MRTATLALALGAGLILAACPGGDGSADGTLTMVDDAFEPEALTVDAGTEITLVNEGQALHNFTVEGADVALDVRPGEETSVMLDLAPGEYPMVCVYHIAEGMDGTITVR